MADEDEVTLQSVDGSEFKVTVGLANMSATMKSLIEDSGAGVTIPLPNITGKILERVVAYCVYHKEHPTPVVEEKKDN